MTRGFIAFLLSLPLAAAPLELTLDPSGSISVSGLSLGLVVSETGNKPTMQDKLSVKAEGGGPREADGLWELKGQFIPGVSKKPLTFSQTVKKDGEQWVVSYSVEGLENNVIDVRMAARLPGKAFEGKAVTFQGRSIPLPLEADTYQLIPDGKTAELALPAKGGDLKVGGGPFVAFLQDRRGKGQDWFECRVQLTRNGSEAKGVFTLSLVPAGSLAGAGAEAAPSWAKYQKVKVEKDLAYLDGDRSEKLDIYRPDAEVKERMPAVLIIHGGGWSGGDKADTRERQIGETLARAGFVAASVNYLLSKKDEPSWPTNIHDVKTAVRYLRSRASKLGIDPERIGTIGGSAGGHLSMLLAWTGDDPRLDPPAYPGVSTKIQAVVDLYGVPDVRLPLSKSTRGCGEGWTGLKAETSGDLFALLSPVTHVRSDGAPVFILHGTADTTVPLAQTEALVKVLEANKARYKLKVVEGAPHTFLIDGPKGDFRGEIVKFFLENL